MCQGNCQKCNGDCQGDFITPKCVITPNKSEYCNLHEFILGVEGDLEKLKEKPEFDLGSLSPIQKEWERDEVIQLLINEVIALKQQLSEVSSSSSLLCSSLDWKPILDCTDCAKTDCEKLQTLINKSGELFDREGI